MPEVSGYLFFAELTDQRKVLIESTVRLFKLFNFMANPLMQAFVVNKFNRAFAFA